jgi:excinuclease UvrABC nuclease subunit
MSAGYAEQIVALLPEFTSWSGRPSAESLSALPGGPAVFLFVDGDARPIQLLTAQQCRKVALARLAQRSEEKTTRADVGEIARGVHWRSVHSPFEARWWHYRTARLVHPGNYRKLIGFPPAWFLHVDWDERVPDLRIVDSLWARPGRYLGPFPARAEAQAAWDLVCDVFDLCRYPAEVRKAPEGQRCAYAEMGRCDAPCDGSVPMARYEARCREAWAFLCDAGRTWLDEAPRRMASAAAELQFELAGQLKGQIDAVRRMTQRWSPYICGPDEMAYLLVVSVSRRKKWKPFLFCRGGLYDAEMAPARKLGEAIASLPAVMRERPPESLDSVTRDEQTWLVAHYLNHRESRAAAVEHCPEIRDAIPQAAIDAVLSRVAELEA